MLRLSAARFTAVLVAPLVVCSASMAAAPSALAAPQLDLPAKRKKAPAKVPGKTPSAKTGKEAAGKKGATLGGKKTGNVTSGQIGETEKKNLIYDDQGRPVATVTTKGQNVPGAGNKGGGGSGLDLPKGGAKKAAPPAGTSGALDVGNRAQPSTPAAPAAGTPAPAGRDPQLQAWERAAEETRPADSDGFDPLKDLASSKVAARFLFDRLEKVRRINDVETEEITDHLARLGEDGLRVARYCLAQDSDVLSYAGARTILISGSGADADRVLLRLRGKLPSRSGPFILTELIERDPVRASTQFLTQMLRHRSGSIRRVAQKELSKRLVNADLPLLLPALSDRSTDVRKAATTLLAGLDDSDLVTEQLLNRVVDSSTSVAEVAIEAIARAEGGDPDHELLRRIFASGEIVKKEALLIVALVEREDRRGKPIFGDQHVPTLLRAMDSPQRLVSASAALALAGLGFRSEDEGSTPWLDGPVPSELVSVATGATFFDGYSLVREPGLRRLRLISGVNFGSNGPDWASWWGDSKDQFRADRAVIAMGPGSARRAILRVDPGGAQRSLKAMRVGRGRPFVLAGSAFCGDADWFAAEYERAGAQGVTVLFLSDGDAEDLVGLLSEEGVFGSGRLPGPRGSFGAGGRSIEIQVDGRSKSFSFSHRQSQAWFERIVARAEGLAERNLWQRFPVKGVHADATELFRLESDWWSAPRTAEERSDRLLGQIAAHLLGQEVEDREEGIAEMQRIVDGRPEAPFPQVVVDSGLMLVAQEAAFGNRARQLTTMVSTLIESGHDEAAKSAERDKLLTILHDQFGPLALNSIAMVLKRGGRRSILAGSIDERETLRVAAALNLGQSDVPEDIDLLMGLLKDPAPDVEIAAIAGLAERKAERARSAIWARARRRSDGSIPTRAAALRATGMIGGAGSLELLLAGLTDEDERFHLPAAQGLASLGTAETAPLLVSLLHSNKRQSIQAAVKRGLLGLGEKGHDDLFGAMRSPDRKLQRDAAILLSQQSVARAVPVLASTIALDPDDLEAIEELAILTCVDYSDEPVPAERYFQWWDEVDHNNAFSWFVAALEQRSVRAPQASAFEGQGTEEARLFLLTLVRELDGHLATRALRELERLHGSPLGPVPVRMAPRDEWFIRVRSQVLPGENEPGVEAGD